MRIGCLFLGIFICHTESALDAAVGVGDPYCDRQWYTTFFDSVEQTFLATLEEVRSGTSAVTLPDGNMKSAGQGHNIRMMLQDARLRTQLPLKHSSGYRQHGKNGDENYGVLQGSDTPSLGSVALIFDWD